MKKILKFYGSLEVDKKLYIEHLGIFVVLSNIFRAATYLNDYLKLDLVFSPISYPCSVISNLINL